MFGNFWQINEADKRLKAPSMLVFIAMLLLCLNVVSNLAMVYHMTDVVHVHSSTTGQLVHLQNSDSVPMAGIHTWPKDPQEDHNCQAAQNALNLSAFLLSFAEMDRACTPCLAGDDVRAKKLEMVYLTQRLHQLAPKQSPPASA